MIDSPYLRPADAIAYCRVTRGQLYKWINEGKLPLYKQGRRSFVKRHELDSLMEAELKPATEVAAVAAKAARAARLHRRPAN